MKRLTRWSMRRGRLPWSYRAVDPLPGGLTLPGRKAGVQLHRDKEQGVIIASAGLSGLGYIVVVRGPVTDYYPGHVTFAPRMGWSLPFPTAIPRQEVGDGLVESWRHGYRVGHAKGFLHAVTTYAVGYALFLGTLRVLDLLR